MPLKPQGVARFGHLPGVRRVLCREIACPQPVGFPLGSNPSHRRGHAERCACAAASRGCARRVLLVGARLDVGRFVVQTMERNFGGIPLLALPFFLNACTMVPRVAERTFWWELTLGLALGLLVTGVFAGAYWFHIRKMDVMLLLIVLYCCIFLAIVGGRAVVRPCLMDRAFSAGRQVWQQWRSFARGE